MENVRRLAVVVFGISVFGLGLLAGRGVERKAIRDGDIACPRLVGWHVDIHDQNEELRKMFRIPKESDPTVLRIYVEREDTGQRVRIQEWTFDVYREYTGRGLTTSELVSFLSK